MARKRMIDPRIWQSEDFSRLTNLAKLVFIGLFSLADDAGRGRANPTYLKSSLFPYEENMKGADIESALFEINSNMSIVFYSCEGNDYYELSNWNKFQKIDKPSASTLPEYIEGDDNIQRLFGEHSANDRRKVAPNRIEKKRIEKNRKEKEEKENMGTVDDFIATYAHNCPKLPQIRTVTNSRKKAIGDFLKTYTLKDWEEVCVVSNTCDFLLRCKRQELESGL